MTGFIMFILLLIAGIILLAVSKTIEKPTKAVIIGIGVVFLLIGAYGIFTNFL